jgi:glycosyltransferase involved in cell wall biosynthesis
MPSVKTPEVDSSATSGTAPKGEWSRSVLVFHNALTRFVQIDCELLARKYAVTVCHETSPRKLRLTKIWNDVMQHDLVYCWFASWHSLLPVLLASAQGKPSVIVVGGYDTANVPEARYGSQRGGLRKIVAGATMKLATHLIANSWSARSETIANGGVRSDKISVIYHGVDLPDIIVQEGRMRMALTVGNVWRENLLRKGLLPFVQAARHLPDVRFVHAGAWQDDSIAELREAAGSNVEFRGFVSEEALAELYSQASVYVQASLHEGFGLSLAEAMAAGCIPVVTRCGALPEVVGDTGIYLSSATPEAIANGVSQALDENYAARQKAQRRIQERFSLEQREVALTRVLDSLILPAALSPRSTRITKHAAG